MKKFLIAGLLAFVFASKAQAYEQVYEKGYSTFTVHGVTCTTGTAVNLSAYNNLVSTQALTGFSDGIRYRFSSQERSVWVFFGSDARVSTMTSSANYGAPWISTMTAGGVVGKEFNLGYNNDQGARAQIWCIAENSAGAAGVRLAREMFGYK